MNHIYNFVSVYSNFVKRREILSPLGRWGVECDKSQNIRSILANHDCCGDRLCGDPSNIKKQIDKEIDNINSKKM